MKRNLTTTEEFNNKVSLQFYLGSVHFGRHPGINGEDDIPRPKYTINVSEWKTSH